MQLDLGDVPAWAALLVSAGAVWVATRANRHAKESAAASRRSADAAERQAQAAEQALAPPAPTVEWRITPGAARDSYVLRNAGSAAATGVEIDRTRAPRHIEIDLRDGVFRPGQSTNFWFFLTAEDPDVHELWVSWDGQPEPVAVPLP